MTEIGMGEITYSLKKKINDLQLELDVLDEPTKELPELISSANLLRSNEYLQKINEKKSELLSTYKQYSKSLEEILSTVFEIQNELKIILREQSAMITSSKTKVKKKPPRVRQTPKK